MPVFGRGVANFSQQFADTRDPETCNCLAEPVLLGIEAVNHQKYRGGRTSIHLSACGGRLVSPGAGPLPAGQFRQVERNHSDVGRSAFKRQPGTMVMAIGSWPARGGRSLAVLRRKG